MRRLAFAVALSAAAFAPGYRALAQQQPAQDARPGIAVFPFVNGGSYGEKQEDLQLLGLGLQQSLMYELGANTNMRVIDRAALRELLQEQDLGKSGRLDASTVAKIGKLVGAKYVVTGGFIDLFGQFQLSGRIIDVSTSEIVKSAQVQGEKRKLFELIADMAGRVTAGVNLPALPKSVQEARKNRQISTEAANRLSRILAYRDEGGNPAKVVELYRALVKDFPQVEEFKAELTQLGG
jgi:TolB-like protein